MIPKVDLTNFAYSDFRSIFIYNEFLAFEMLLFYIDNDIGEWYDILMSLRNNNTQLYQNFMDQAIYQIKDPKWTLLKIIKNNRDNQYETKLVEEVDKNEAEAKDQNNSKETDVSESKVPSDTVRRSVHIKRNGKKLYEHDLEYAREIKSGDTIFIQINENMCCPASYQKDGNVVINDIAKKYTSIKYDTGISSVLLEGQKLSELFDKMNGSKYVDIVDAMISDYNLL